MLRWLRWREPLVAITADPLAALCLQIQASMRAISSISPAPAEFFSHLRSSSTARMPRSTKFVARVRRTLHRLLAAMRHRRYPARATIFVLSASVLACTSTVSEKPSAFPQLDAVAQARRYDAMQNAFEHYQSGQIAFWSENSRVGGRVVPIATIHTSLYGWCRECEERIATDRASHRLVGIACRTERGQWLIVDIRSYVEVGQPRI